MFLCFPQDKTLVYQFGRKYPLKTRSFIGFFPIAESLLYSFYIPDCNFLSFLLFP